MPPDRLHEVQTRFASQLHVNPLIATDALILNTRMAPFNDVRVRRAINYAIDRGKIARLLGQGAEPTCQVLPPYLPGYRRYCPYTLDPTPAGVWHAPNLARGRAPDRRLAHPRHADHDLEPRHIPARLQDDRAVPRLAPRPARLPDPDQGPHGDAQRSAAVRRLAHERTSRLISFMSPIYLSASQMIQLNFACQSFLPELDRQRKPLRILRSPARRPDPQRARGREQQLATRSSAMGTGRPNRHRPGAGRPARHASHDRLRLLTRRQLPIQLPARHAVGPALGALAAPPYG